MTKHHVARTILQFLSGELQRGEPTIIPPLSAEN